MTAQPEAFGRYRVSSKLGAGGMGAVYLAVDESLGREVAVKVLRPLLVMGEPPAELVERFRREARAIAALTHPAVVRIYDQGIDGEHPYLVMELVRGPTLADRMREGHIAAGEIRTLGIQIAGALAAAHEAGIVHRDVKPSNILQAATGSWKLADFGIAHTGDTSLTITGQFLGTPAFAPPEAIEGGPVGAPADVYSLAATLYAALTGEPPYGGGSVAKVVAAMEQGHPVPVGERRADLPAHVSDAIDHALSRSPEDRPTATELAEELAANRAPARATAATTPSPRTPAVRTRLYALAALVFGAIAVALVVSGSKRHRAAPAKAAHAPQTAAPAIAPAIEPGTPPPWREELPPELTRPIQMPPDPQQTRWHEAYRLLQEGDWDQAEKSLDEILANERDNQTARRWLDWMQAARHDPDSFGVVIEED